MNIQLHDEGAAKPLPPAREKPPKIADKDISEEQFDLRDVFDLLRRQIRLILSTIAIIAAMAGIATLTITPIYTASTLVLFDPQRNSLLDPTAQASASLADSSARVESEVEILRSDGILLQVIRSANLVTDPEFGVRPGLRDRIAAFLRSGDAQPLTEQEALGRALDRLKKSVSVQRLGLTYVISITVSSQDPEKAAELANTLARTYIAHQVRVKVQGLLDARDVIREQTEALRQAGNEDLQQLQSSLEETAMNDARGDLAAATRPGDLPADMLTELHEARQRAANAVRQYDQLLARQQALDTEASLQLASSMIVSEATTPTRASFPDKRVIAGVAALLALGAGVGAAFLFENYIGGFTTAERLQALTRKRLGTIVPREAMEPGSSSLADILVSAPLSRYSESIRRLRVMLHAVLQRPPNAGSGEETQGAVIMVSSALPNEGKTTVALSLARAYALSGERVLVLDCDLRSPGIHKHLNVEGSTGLVDVVAGNVTHRNLSKVLVNDPKTTLTSIVGARHVDLPTDQLVASKSLNQIIAAARQNFDYVVIDSPPLESVVDGLYLADYADAIVFVTRWAKTPQRAVTSAISRLESALRSPAEIVVVLNQQEGRFG